MVSQSVTGEINLASRLRDPPLLKALSAGWVAGRASDIQNLGAHAALFSLKVRLGEKSLARELPGTIGASRLPCQSGWNARRHHLDQTDCGAEKIVGTGVAESVPRQKVQ